MNLKIGFFINARNTWAGIGQWIASLSEFYHSSGCKVSVLILSEDHEALELAKTRYMKLNIEAIGLIASTSFVETVNNLAEKIADSQFDVYFPNYTRESWTAAALYKKNNNLVTVGAFHSQDSSYERRLMYYQDMLELFLAFSPTASERLKTLIPLRKSDIVYIPHGISSISKLPNSFNDTTLKLVFHGRINQSQKSVFSFLEIATKLVKSNVDFVLDLYGDGPELEEMNARIVQLNLKKYISMKGVATHSNLSDILSKYHVWLLCSKHEGGPIALLEAMGSGLVPVCFDAGGMIRDAVKNQESGFVINSPSEMVAKIVWLNNNRDKMKYMSINAKKTIEEFFLLDKIVTKQLKIFEICLRSKTSRQWPDSKSIHQPKYVSGRLDRLPLPNFVKKILRSVIMHLK